ncbi:CAP Gly-rich domain-containing protein, partial [Catenaria anguillulae PL171]
TVSLGGSPIVTLFVESDTSIASERRFDKAISIPQLKARLEPITGILAHNQHLLLVRDSDKATIATIQGDDSVMLGAFPVENFMVLRVIDTNPGAASTRNQYTDVSLVQKYEMEDDKYDRLQDSVRDFKRRNKLGRFDDAKSSLSSDSSLPEPLCHRVNLNRNRKWVLRRRFLPSLFHSHLIKRGQVMYVGLTDFKQGVWVGVEYDEPVGKHNGTVAGKTYFTARNKHAAFVRPNRVQVGDFPELDLF